MNPRKLCIIAAGVIAGNALLYWHLSTRDLGRIIKKEIRNELYRRDIADLRALSSELTR